MEKSTRQFIIFYSVICSLLIFQTSLLAQYECGTVFPESPTFSHEELEIYRSQYRALRTHTINEIPIKAHIVRREDGSRGLSETELKNAILSLNGKFSGTDMQFFLCHPINYIYRDLLSNFSSENEADLAQNNAPNAINIYFVDSITDSKENKSLCGYTYHPRDDKRLIILSNSCAINNSTLSHEMGHYWGLEHTFGKGGLKESKELVDRTNCKEEGDHLCQTEADPGLDASNVKNCIYVGTKFDALGKKYTPNVDNLMSYAPKNCRTKFVEEQEKLMMMNFAKYGSYLNNSNCEEEICKVPQYLQAQNITSTSAQLSCTPFFAAKKYQWQMRIQDAENWTDLGTSIFSSFQIKDQVLKNKTVYEFRVRVNIGEEWCEWSSLGDFQVGTPLLARVTNRTSFSALLYCNSVGATSYQWQIKTQYTSNWTELGTTVDTFFQITEPELERDTRYEFRVRANINGSWCEWSDIGSFVTLPCKSPSIEEELGFFSLNYTSIVQNIFRWRVCRSDGTDCKEKITSGPDISMEDLGISPNETYYIQAKIRCIDGYGEGAWSSKYTFTPQCIQPKKLIITGPILYLAVEVVNQGENFKGVKDFELQYKPINSGTWLSITSPVGYFQFWPNDLMQNTTYQFRARQQCIDSTFTDWTDIYQYPRSTAENANPSVTITTPVTESIFKEYSNIEIKADASDSDGLITHVEFYNGSELLGSDDSAPYYFIWEDVLEGTYALTARAYDNQGGWGISTPVLVIVKKEMEENEIPIISITSPNTGAEYFIPTNIPITATATDPDGTITHVEFSANDIFLGSDGTSPYTFNWQNVPEGTYTLIAKAYDNENGIGISLPVTIIVKKQAGGGGGDCSKFIANIQLLKSGECTTGGGQAQAIVTEGEIPYKYQWSNGQTNEMLSDVSAGKYDLTVTDNQNCEAIATITIPLKVPEVTITNIQSKQAIVNWNSYNDVTIFRVEYRIAGQSGTILSNITDNAVTLTNLLANTNYEVFVIARCSSSGIESTATFTIFKTPPVDVGNIPPSISITNPDNGTTFIIPATIPITATATDADGTITHVEFYANDIFLGSDGTLPYSFNWQNVPEGTYTLTAKAYDNDNAVGISSSVIITVKRQSGGVDCTSFQLDPNPILPDVIFPCDQQSYTVYVKGGKEPYSYKWSNGSTDSHISGTSPGNYSVTVTDADGCTLTSTIEVPLIEKPIVNLQLVKSGNCASGGGEARAIVTKGEAPYTYLWSNGQTTSTLTNISAGTYSLLVNDKLDCLTESSITIPLKAPDVTFTNTQSKQTTVNWNSYDDGTVFRVEYRVVGQSGIVLNNLTDNYITLTNLLPNTNYEVFVIATCIVSGIESTITFTTFKTLPPENSNIPPIISLTNPSSGAIFTAPASITLIANASDPDGFISKVEFYNGAALMNIDNTAPYSFAWNGVGVGNIYLTAKAYDNLGAVTTSAPVPASIISQCSFNITTTEIEPSCYKDNSSVVANASGGVAPYTYLWSNGSTAKEISNVPTNTYTVTATDSRGCKGISTITLSANVCQIANGPVCGSDGKEYTNACDAECAGVSWTQGGCNTPPISDCWCSNSAADYICEDFQSYPVGANGDGFISPNSPCWTTNSGVEGGVEDGVIRQLADGAKYLRIQGTNPSGGAQNVILQLGDRTSEKYRLNFQIWVYPQDKGHFRILNTFNAGSNNNTVSHEVYFDGYGSGRLKIGNESKRFNHTSGTWIDVIHDFDLNTGKTSLSIDGQFIKEWTMTTKRLSAINFYPPTDSYRFFMDDIVFEKQEECICPPVYDPVCGSDGNEYSNACEAECAGLTSWTPGPCECICPAVYDPVCGSDGNEYSNACEAECGGITSWTPGPCECICPAVYDPVCGSDGNQYSNACEAECAGLTSWTPGPCECICPAVYDPVCGTDGKTYSNACEAECAGVAIVSFGECNTTSNDLLLYLPFNGNANDASGNGFHGTVYGAKLTTDRLGNSNSAYSFNGSNNYISIADNTRLDIGQSDYTMAFWIKTNASSNGRIISKGSSYCTTGYMARTTGSTILLENAARGNCKVSCFGGKIINDGKWHCVVGVIRRDGSAKLYVDGVLDKQTQINTASLDLSNALNLTIGVSHLTTLPEWFSGSLDEIRLYSKALSAQEITSLCQGSGRTRLNSVTIYPNPAKANARLNIFYESAVESESTITIHHVTGQTVLEQKQLMYSGRNNFEIALPDLSSGLYLVQIQQGEETFVQRLVVQ